MAALLHTLQINSAHANYSVDFSDRADLSEWRPQADAFLVDVFFRNRLSFPGSTPVIWVEATESAKGLEAVLPVFVALKEAGFRRGSHLMAIGGGVVQDIATFVASLYMRGITWSYVPTTLLGMADSCLGGKSSINVGPYKNLIGNFYPPREIEIMPAFVRSLPPSELTCGAAEAAKIAFCRGSAPFATYERLVAPLLAGDWKESQLVDLLYATLNVKRWFIEIDEFDQAERRLLNFGHTWGHALESATSFAVPHGLAVAIGMMASICFVVDQPTKIHHSRLWQHCVALLAPVLELDQLASFSAERFITAFQADKKHSPRSYRLIVPNSSNSSHLGVQEIDIPSDTHSMELVLQAMRHALQALSQELLSSRIPPTAS